MEKDMAASSTNKNLTIKFETIDEVAINMVSILPLTFEALPN